MPEEAESAVERAEDEGEKERAAADEVALARAEVERVIASVALLELELELLEADASVSASSLAAAAGAAAPVLLPVLAVQSVDEPVWIGMALEYWTAPLESVTLMVTSWPAASVTILRRAQQNPCQRLALDAFMAM